MSSDRLKYKHDFLKGLGVSLKEIRRKRGLSQFELAVECELPKNQIGRIERGEINTSIFTLKRIADTLKIDLKELF